MNYLKPLCGAFACAFVYEMSINLIQHNLRKKSEPVRTTRDIAENYLIQYQFTQSKDRDFGQYLLYQASYNVNQAELENIVASHDKVERYRIASLWKEFSRS